MQRLTVERTQQADHYLKSRGFETSQRNGQRISILAGKTLDDTDGKCREVFVGKLPRDLFEDELLPKFEMAGPVYKIRLMMDFSGTNRGYCFVQYFESADANYACKYINGSRLRLNSPEPIGVCPSFNNRGLFFGNIPVNINAYQLRDNLDRILEGIESIRMMDVKPKAKSRNATIIFKTHEAATQARRLLCPGNVKVFGRTLCVDWAKPEAPKMDDVPPTRTEAQILLIESLEKLMIGATPSSSGASSASTLGSTPRRMSPNYSHYFPDNQYYHQNRNAPFSSTLSCASSLGSILNTYCSNERLLGQTGCNWNSFDGLLN